MARDILYRLDDYPVANIRSDFSGWDLFDRNHNLVGTIEDMLVDPDINQICHAIAHIGADRVLIPVSAIDPDWDRRCVTVHGFTESELRSLTAYRETLLGREEASIMSRR